MSCAVGVGGQGLRRLKMMAPTRGTGSVAPSQAQGLAVLLPDRGRRGWPRCPRILGFNAGQPEDDILPGAGRPRRSGRGSCAPDHDAWCGERAWPGGCTKLRRRLLTGPTVWGVRRGPTRWKNRSKTPIATYLDYGFRVSNIVKFLQSI